MAEATLNRLQGNVARLERSISIVKQSIRTNKKFAQGVDYSEALRTKSLAALKSDENQLKDLQDKLKKANTNLKDLVATERAAKGKKKAELIESKYARLQDSLDLQLDPTSAAAQKIKDNMESLIDDYKSALSATSKRAVSVTEARSKLTGSAVPSFGKPVKAKAAEKAVTLTKPEVTSESKIKTTEEPKVTPDLTGTSLAKKEAAKTKAIAGKSDAKIVSSDYAQRNIGMAKAKQQEPGAKTPLKTLLEKTEYWYDLPDYIFNLDPKLGELLVEAVAGDWDDAKFLAKAKLTPWWQKNSDRVRTKIVDRAKYDELKAANEDVTKSDYGLYLSKQMRAVKAQARDIAGVTLTDAQAQSVAQKIYEGNLEDDPLAINALITPFIGKTTSIVGTGTGTTGFGGQALQNYQTLQGIAKANGFALRDVLPNVSAITAGGDLETAVLRGLADGTIDINRVAQDARMLASQGQPQYVRNLLGQGYDLEAVYAPYRQTMANELELRPDEIDLNDTTLRMAITDKGDMNLYDFKKALRQDNRWQYTGQAKEEVSNAALKVLQDFGFQG